MSFQDPIDRQAAILARAQRIVSSEQFKKLDRKNQTHMLSRYYDTTVAPGYHQKGFDAPDKKVWIHQIHSGYSSSPASYYGTTAENSIQDFSAAATRAFAYPINVAGVWISKEAFKASVGLAKIFPYGDSAQLAEALKNKTTGLDHFNKISHDIVDTSTFWLNTHPTKAWQETMSSGIGEVVGSLPMYEAIGEARIAMLGRVGDVTNLTQTLGATEKGVYVARKLGEASDAFFGSLIGDGASPRDASMSAAKWVALTSGPTLGFKGLKLAGSGVIKAFSSRIATQGGHVLQDTITAEAAATLNKGMPVTHHDIDPVKASLISAEQHVLNSMSKLAMGTPFVELSKSEQAAILADRSVLHQKGIAEVAIHNPKETKELIHDSIQNDIQQFPMLGQTVKAIKDKFGIDVSDALHEAEVEKVAKETGIQSSQNTIEKITKSKPKPLSPERVKVNQQSARAYVQYKVDSLVYMKNNFSKKAGAVAGNWKAKNAQLAKYFDGLDSEDFMKELNDETGNSIKFESQEHQLLWANQYRDQLPKPIAARIQAELHEIDPTGTHAGWDKKSANLAAHMQELAYTGHLFDEGNVFKSTKVDNWVSKTKWQLQLREETEAQEMANLKLTMSKYPEQYKTAASIMKNLQLARRRVRTVENYMAKTKEIRDIKVSSLKKALE